MWTMPCRSLNPRQSLSAKAARNARASGKMLRIVAADETGTGPNCQVYPHEP